MDFSTSNSDWDKFAKYKFCKLLDFANLAMLVKVSEIKMQDLFKIDSVNLTILSQVAANITLLLIYNQYITAWAINNTLSPDNFNR